MKKILAVMLLPILLITAHPVSALDAGSPTVLITGSNRGIGLALARHYAAGGWNVIASCRSPQRADKLTALAENDPKVVVEQLDVTDYSRIDELAAEYSGQPIDLLINNAAILGDLASQKVGGLDHALFQRVMDVNVFGPMRMSEAFADHVAASGQKKIVALTSGLGSLTLMGKMSGFYYYRISKAGLNMAMRALRTDLANRDIVVGIVAPGMVQTQMLEDSGYRGKALSPEESARGLAGIIAGLTADDPGLPINVDGKTIPW